MDWFQVTCVSRRPDHFPAHERLLALGGISRGGWFLTEANAIEGIESGRYGLRMMMRGVQSDLVVAVHNGRKYLKADGDGYAPDILLSLPECQERR